jgi:hypothetical protein
MMTDSKHQGNPANQISLETETTLRVHASFIAGEPGNDALTPSPQPGRDASRFPSQRSCTIDWLEAHNYPTLPVAPAQCPRKYPKIARVRSEQGAWTYCPLDPQLQPLPLFTGKNPSYLDKDGTPHLLNHRQYQNRLPSHSERQAWFAHPANGIGTLGGWNDTVWLDFDLKQFPSERECDAAVEAVLARIVAQSGGSGQQTFIEQTHSGGWRVGIRVRQKPDFTNFAIAPGGTHAGEALFTGRFTVLAPTLGPSGNPYQSLSRALPPLVDSLNAIGIYSTRRTAPQPGRAGNPPPPSTPRLPVRLRSPSGVEVSGVEVSGAEASTPQPGCISLEQLGSDLSRDILRGYCPTGDRSEALTTAIREWYGWENWGQNNGIFISGNAMEYAHQAGTQLGLESDRIARILKSVDPTDCQPAALHRGGEESCWRKVRRLDPQTYARQCPPDLQVALSEHQSTPSEVETSTQEWSPRTPPERRFRSSLNAAVLRNQIKDILRQDLPPGELQAAKIHLRANTPGLSERELSQLFATLERELEWEESRGDRRAEVDDLLKLGDRSLNLDDFLPADLAEPLAQLARGLNIRPEVCLTSLLVATSSLHKTPTELTIHRGQGFSVPPTLFAGLVSESGQKKSPLLKAIVKKPLAVLQREKREAFKAALIQYEKDLTTWEKCASAEERSARFPEGKPQKPQQQLYYFTNATGEGLLYQYQAHPERALLALFDELAGLFASQNKYRGGRGSDRQDILSAFDGTGATVLRAGGTRADLDGLLLSIFGTIQPEVLKGLMRDCTDPDGQWARFLFVNQPLAAATLSDDDGSGLDLTERLLDYYRALDRLPAREYRLSRAAFKRYQPLYNQLERLRVSHPSPGMRAVYSKMEGYVGRLALNLHVLHELAAGKTQPDLEIPLPILENAIALAKFYIGQVKLIHANCTADLGEMAPHLVKIVELSKRLDTTTGEAWIKAKTVQNGYDSRHRPRPNEIRSWFRELEALGIGTTRGTGIHLEYSWQLAEPLVEESGEKWISSPPTECPHSRGFEKKVEKVDSPTAFHESPPNGGYRTRGSTLILDPPTPPPPGGAAACGDMVGFYSPFLRCSYPTSASVIPTLSPLSSGLEISYPGPSYSNSPLWGWNDDIARPQAVDSLSTFSPSGEMEAPLTDSVGQGELSPPPDPTGSAANEKSLTQVELQDASETPTPESVASPSLTGETKELRQTTPSLKEEDPLPDPWYEEMAVRAEGGEEESELGQTQHLAVGDWVIWESYPGNCDRFSPFEIVAIEGDCAKLDLFRTPVPLAELRWVRQPVPPKRE